MQGNAYLIKAFTFSGRFEEAPSVDSVHVGSLRFSCEVRNMETCATTALFRRHLTVYRRAT